MRWWTPAERAELRRLWSAGVPGPVVAHQLGRTHRAVQKMAMRMGVESPNVHDLRRAETEARVIACLDRGLHQNQTARELGFRQGYVGKVIARLVAAGIIERPRPRACYRVSEKWVRWGGSAASNGG